MASDERVRHPTGEGDDLTIYFDKSKVLIWVSLGIILTMGGVVATLVPSSGNPDTGLQIIGPLYILLMGSVTVGQISRLFSSSPRLVINHQGIRINSKLLGVGIIEWQEITGLLAYRAPWQTRLAIVLADPRAILSRQPWPQRLVYLLLKGNLMSSDAIVTSDGSLPISMNELLVQIRDRYHHELLHYHIVIRDRKK